LVGMQTVSVDRKGRVTIPKEAREHLNLSEEDRLVVTVDKGEVRLSLLVPEQPKLRRRRRWGKEAFPRAGEALFAGDE